MAPSPIQAYITESAKKRTRWELLLALGALLLIILLSWIELQFFGVNSYLFLAIFNLNLILLLVVLFLVLRNAVKLFLDRKRNVRGSKLRTKLVQAFILLSILPTLLMFFMAVKFVQTSVDYWFRTQVDTSMDQALEVGKNIYAMTSERLGEQGRFILDRIRERELLWGGPGMDRYLQRKASEYSLSLVGVLRPDIERQNWHAATEWQGQWPQAKTRINWTEIKQSPQMRSVILQGGDRDLLLEVVPVDDAETGFLVLGRTFEHGFLNKLEEIAKGVTEYKQLKRLKNPLKTALYIILGIMTLLIVLGAMWFGFRLAKEISAPIQALSQGTKRIAEGDLGVRLEDQSSDELGMLVQSFNTMAEDLERSQQRLNQANRDLALQNQELERRRRYMEAVLNNITSGVVSLDTGERISTLNSAAEKILNVDADSLMGSHPQEILPEDYHSQVRYVLDKLKSSPDSHWQKQLDIPLSAGERKLLINAVGLTGELSEEMGVVVVFEDITELDKMQRMAAWREVARRVAHEIKNPLTPIKLSAQRLERKYGPQLQEDSFSESIDLIVRQVEHMQQMVKDFSTFAKLPELSFRENEISHLLEEAVSLFQTSHPHIRWSLHAEEGIPVFRFDRSALRRVVINLLSNASEVLQDREAPQVDVAAGALSGGRQVWIAIRDNGPGLEAEEQDKLFEPYFSKKKSHTGLGLTIVKSIVNDHQGSIRVEPTPGGGLTFRMQFPV
jgi:two-component system nitrogen regulation sensor histidine kinase NtrY